MAPRIVLMGPPGSGKSSVARALSKRTGKSFLDTDGLVEAKAGKKVSEIFIEEGEIEFRRMENAEVLAALEGDEEIIALGGGSVLDSDVQVKMASLPCVVFLDVSISNAAPRVGFNRERPLLVGNPRAQWLSLMEARRPIYERLATLTVSTDNKKPDEVAQEILERMPA